MKPFDTFLYTVIAITIWRAKESICHVICQLNETTTRVTNDLKLQNVIIRKKVYRKLIYF